MSKVHLEILSSLVETIDSSLKKDIIVLEHEIEEGVTVNGLLNRLSIKYKRFGEVIFDVRAQKLTERVNIFLNGRNLELENGLSTILSDGDIVTFITPIVGG